MNTLIIDLDKLEQELNNQELFLDEAQWLSVIAALKKAKVAEDEE